MPDYLVTWKIDVDESADNPEEAAAQALIAMRDTQSGATVFDVQDKTTGVVTTVDLSNEPEHCELRNL